MNRRSFLQTTAAVGLSGVADCASADEADGDAQVADSASRDMIWDLHCHFSGVPGPSIEDRTEQILEYADRMGVQRLVFFMGWPWSQNPKPDDFRRQNDQVLEALAKWPDRLLGFAYLSGHYPRESLREIERCIAAGPMVGIKLWVARKCSDEALDPIIARCGELNAAIYQHTWLKTQGNNEGESTPMDLALLADRHPTVPIICGHTGGDWTRGIRAVRASKNVSIGIGGSEPTSGFVEMAVRELGAERVIYGSDAGGRSFSSQLAKVYGAEVPEAAKQLILGKNLKRMLSPILRAKGIPS
jgi:predicted TIM-barrel fold metal-dependent hydrolase